MVVVEELCASFRSINNRNTAVENGLSNRVMYSMSPGGQKQKMERRIMPDTCRADSSVCGVTCTCNQVFLVSESTTIRSLAYVAAAVALCALCALSAA